MENLSSHFSKLKAYYRKTFLEYANVLLTRIVELKTTEFEGDIFDKYLKGSIGYQWQKSVLEFVDLELKKIPKEVQKVKLSREDFSCCGCGVCCKFAVSEFSPQELGQKALQGDVFASQFVKTFEPYDSIEKVKRIFPQYLEFLEKSETAGGYYFYHCPRVTKDNKCPDYENRPQICRDFPDNPIAFLPLSCGYNEWKRNTEKKMLELNAKSEILNFYKERLVEIV